MPETKWRQTVASIRDMVLARDTAGIGDAALLELFVSAGDGAAFEAIVRRHGPLVNGVCLRVLQNASDAEDAFQATFLVLVRKAAGLKRPELLGNWLHGVAFQTARSARATARRHRKLEARLIPREPPSAPDYPDELSIVLDEELACLPAKYRIPIVLCELQEKSRKEAAAILGIPEGTISSRLARGKALLAQRLAGRNITLGSAAIAASLASTSVAPSAALVQLTVRAGTAAVAGKAAAIGVASAKAIQLSETVMTMMFASKLKLSALLLAGSALLMTGAGLLTAQSLRGSSESARPVSPPADQKQTTTPPTAQIALFHATLDAAAEINDPQERLKLFLRLAKVQIEASNRVGAIDSLAKALALVRGMENGTEKARFIRDIAVLEVEAGERAQGFQIAKELEKLPLVSMNQLPLNTGLVMLIELWTFLDEFEEGRELIRRNPHQQGTLVPAMIRTMQPRKGHEPAARDALQHLAEAVSKWPNKGNLDPATDPDLIPNSVDKLQTLDSIAVALARAGYAEDALRRYEANRAMKVEGTTRSTVLLEMVEALANAGKFSEASKVAAQIANDSRYRLDAAYAIAIEQARVGDFAGALQTVSDTSTIPGKVAVQRDFTSGIKSVALHGKVIAKANVLLAIGLTQIANGNRKAALAILDDLRQLNEENGEAAEPETIDLRDIGSNGRSRWRLAKLTPRVAQVQLEAGLDEFQAARKTAGNLTSAIEKAQAFLFLGKSLLAAGKKSEATQALSRASRSAERIAVVSNRAAQVGVGRRGQAGSIGGSSTDMNKNLLLNQIAGLQAQAGDVEGAFETAESFQSQAGLDSLVVDIAAGGETDAAIDSLAKLASTEAKARALEGIGRAMCRQGKEKAAAALASKQKNPLLRAYTLLGMAIGSGTVAKQGGPPR